MAKNSSHATLGVISFGLALGITWGLLVFLLGLMAALFNWGTGIAMALATLYYGFAPNFVGTIAGAVWAFAHGYFAGVILAWLYNKFLLGRRRHLE